MKKVKFVKAYKLNFDLWLIDNYAFLGYFTSKKKAIKKMKKLTKKFNKRDEKDAWKSPLRNFNDYSITKELIPYKEFKKLKKKGK